MFSFIKFVICIYTCYIEIDRHIDIHIFAYHLYILYTYNILHVYRQTAKTFKNQRIH